MLTTQPPPPPPPAALPPQRGRRVGRRHNRVLAIIFLSVIAVFGVAVAYTLYDKAQQQARQRQLAQTAPSGADASTVLKDAPSGYIKAAIAPRPPPPPKVEKEPLPAAQKEQPKEEKPPPPDDNGREAERKAAWKRYWTEYEELRKDRFDRRKEAIYAMKTSVEAGTQGAAASPAAAAPAAAAAPVPVVSTSPGFAGQWGGNGFNGGLGGFGGYGAGWPGVQNVQIDREGQEQKIGFAGQKGDLGKDDVVPTHRKPSDPYAVLAGSFVKFTALNEVNSDVPGTWVGMVSQSVYSTSDGNCELIPQGSKLIGKYNSVVSVGQDRLPGVLTRINFPDGSHQSIGAMEMADNRGSAGLEDQVNRHLLQKFGAAALSGAFGAGIYLAVPHNTGFNNGIDATSIIGASLAQQIGQVGQQITQQALQIPNTITIRAGYEGTMITDKDIHIEPPWSCNGRHGGGLPIMQVSQ